MRDADRLRAQKAASTDPDRLEREARMAETKQMTVLKIMAKAAKERAKQPIYNVPELESVLVGCLGDGWDPLLRAALTAIRGWPLANIAIEVGKHIDMRPADVDLVLTAAIDTILAEKSK